MSASVCLENVSLSYPVFGAAGRSLKVALMRQFVGSRVTIGDDDVHVDALSRVSFELKPGDRLGLVGRNGSGKSTVLKLIAGLMHPSAGRILVRGRVVSLIEKGLGINPELTGFENIELPLRLLGATDAEVRAARAEVPEFTGLGAFMHVPVRTYSDGMKARLAFALCTSLDADVLVVDEWLGAGDIDFVERAKARLEAMLERSGIVVMATHATDLMHQVCNKAAWLDKGRLRMIGDVAPVIEAYHGSYIGHSEVV